MVKEDVMINSVKSSREIKKTGYLSEAYKVYDVVINVDKCCFSGADSKKTG